jgi:hypothetical protein
LRNGTDGTPEKPPNVRQFSGEFLQSGGWRRGIRSPPELAAVADGMKENFSGGRFGTGTGFPELWERGA